MDHIRFGIATTATAPTTWTPLPCTAATPSHGAGPRCIRLGSPTAPTISQFVFGADTYLVLDLSTATTFSAGDLAIKFTGTPGVALSRSGV